MENNTSKLVYSFGEKGSDQWYAYKDNKRIKCDEDIISRLWGQWVVSAGSERDNKNGYNIYINYMNPMTI